MGLLARAGLLLCVVCWKRRAVLAGICGSTAVALTIAAIATDSRASPARTLLAADVIALVTAVALLTLGQVIWRLLDDTSADGP